MARKVRQNKPRRPEKVEFRGYVNYRIGKEEREAFEVWANQQSDLVGIAVELAVKDQLKFSVGEDLYHEAYGASYMCQDRQNPACGCVLTSWAKDMYTAIALLVYKHVVLANRQWHYEASGYSTDLEMG